MASRLASQRGPPALMEPAAGPEEEEARAEPEARDGPVDRSRAAGGSRPASVAGRQQAAAPAPAFGQQLLPAGLPPWHLQLPSPWGLPPLQPPYGAGWGPPPPSALHPLHYQPYLPTPPVPAAPHHQQHWSPPPGLLPPYGTSLGPSQWMQGLPPQGTVLGGPPWLVQPHQPSPPPPPPPYAMPPPHQQQPWGQQGFAPEQAGGTMLQMAAGRPVFETRGTLSMRESFSRWEMHRLPLELRCASMRIYLPAAAHGVRSCGTSRPHHVLTTPFPACRPSTGSMLGLPRLGSLLPGGISAGGSAAGRGTGSRSGDSFLLRREGPAEASMGGRSTLVFPPQGPLASAGGRRRPVPAAPPAVVPARGLTQWDMLHDVPFNRQNSMTPPLLQRRGGIGGIGGSARRRSSWAPAGPVRGSADLHVAAEWPN